MLHVILPLFTNTSSNHKLMIMEEYRHQHTHYGFQWGKQTLPVLTLPHKWRWKGRWKGVEINVSCMNILQMFLQAAFLGKRPWTYCTRKWFFPSMSDHVLLQFKSSLKCLRTQTTGHSRRPGGATSWRDPWVWQACMIQTTKWVTLLDCFALLIIYNTTPGFK